ncbi:MerR family transcriptional regulator [Rathayibacter sp. VKM Ac-2630]|uniref:MerR family transcriptional regulator n=1 Tax=Rathayibacter sp. VKM Ac-2630 TaxID=1938617 RepID=UPI00191C1321|nr:MerR family transcriptional regulator [Rathayibacter sp. VKM Ac-2630]
MTDATVNITTRKLAEAIPVDPSTVRRWVEKGLLIPTAVTPGGHFRFDLAEAKRQLGMSPSASEAAHTASGSALQPTGPAANRLEGSFSASTALAESGAA